MLKIKIKCSTFQSRIQNCCYYFYNPKAYAYNDSLNNNKNTYNMIFDTIYFWLTFILTVNQSENYYSPYNMPISN